MSGGSGWVLLTYSYRDRALTNQWAADHTHALAGGAATYVDAFMRNIRWENVPRLYQECARK
jgi:Fe-Mn family superoxide dismutase